MENDVFDVLHRAYSLSKATGEVIGGRFAEDFAGKATWSRALDLDVPGHPDIQGLRYMDFKDCTNVHVLYKDGESKFMEDTSPEELEALVEAVKAQGLDVSKKDEKPFWDEEPAGDDLGWCEEVYTIRFDEKDRRDFAPEDPAYKASHILTAWLDLEESGYAEGVPLGLVMDELGFNGDRDGLTDHSVVKDVVVGGEGVSFKVEDNFSNLDICRSLADRLNVDIDVSVRYRFSEFDGILDHESDEQHFVARATKGLAKKVEDGIQFTLEQFGRKGGVVPVLSFTPFKLMTVESLGPEPDRINLVSAERPLDGDQERMSVRLGEIKDPVLLERLLDMVKSNFEQLAYEVQRRWDATEAVQKEPAEAKQEKVTDDIVEKYRASCGWIEASGDVTTERHGVLKSLYGSSSAYQNISEFMEGFDISIRYADNIDMTREDAIEIASHALTADGHETDLSGEVIELLNEELPERDRLDPQEALMEWDIDIPMKEPDRLVLHYDGDPMMEFDILKDEPWPARNIDESLVDFFQERTGIDLRHEFGLGRDYAGTEGKKVMETCIRALTSPQNREMIKDATRKAARRARHREMFERFEAGSSKGKDKGKGIH